MRRMSYLDRCEQLAQLLHLRGAQSCPHAQRMLPSAVERHTYHRYLSHQVVHLPEDHESITEEIKAGKPGLECNLLRPDLQRTGLFV